MSRALTEPEALLILNGLPHVGPVLLRRLLDAFSGDATAILSASRSQWLCIEGIGPAAADVLHNWPDHFDLEREKQLLAERRIRFLSREQSDYPRALLEMYDPPIGLYWNGNYTVERPCVAIVGTRAPTLYGIRTAQTIAAGLTRLGFCVVSGMARGIDTAAHQGALEAGGPTIAVLGCGLDIIYPPENLELYRAIARSGAVVSEFPFGRRADRQTFPMRNRVVAGLCTGVLVIESGASGGSMITARFAGELGRTLMAVPGRVDQPSSAGCHQLIRDGAILVTTLDEILAELGYRNASHEAAKETASPIAELSEAEQTLLHALCDGALLSADALCQTTQLPVPLVNSTLMALELKRLVAKHADGRFEASIP
ncbi:MAG: DNA-processing protein DprA [Coraliomargaritaceae bacterium]